MPTAIEVEDLGKRYWLGEDDPGRSLREALVQSILRMARGRSPIEQLWALRDVNFELVEGEALGVLGSNGAGKTTLLRILSRITEPTTGVSRTRGRVASLLEVGTGFHSELTGRENVFVNGAILGLSRRDIDRRFADIVEFSGVERFLDTPIKRYSDGMRLRLAFAVAAHLEPDILVVDEILAVGDAEFQRKCLRRMAEVEREGRTVVFVSHDLEAILRLCPRAIWLDRGRVQDDGPAGRVIDAYLSSGFGPQGLEQRFADPKGSVVLRSVRVTDPQGRTIQVLRRDQPFVVELRLWLRDRLPGLDAAVYVMNTRGVRVFDEAWSDTSPHRPDGPGEYLARLRVPAILNVGDYRVGAWIGTAHEDLLVAPSAASFRLEGSAKHRPDRVVELLLPWEVHRLDEAPPDQPPGIRTRR